MGGLRVGSLKFINILIGLRKNTLHLVIVLVVINPHSPFLCPSSALSLSCHILALPNSTSEYILLNLLSTLFCSSDHLLRSVFCLVISNSVFLFLRQWPLSKKRDACMHECKERGRREVRGRALKRVHLIHSTSKHLNPHSPFMGSTSPHPCRISLLRLF